MTSPARSASRREAVIADDTAPVIAPAGAYDELSEAEALQADGAVVFEADGGAWILGRDPTAGGYPAPGRYLAGWRPGRPGDPALFAVDLPAVRAPSSWALEPLIGFEIPFVVHAALITRQAPGLAATEPPPPTPDGSTETAEHYPRPGDAVHLPSQGPLTYRQALGFTQPVQSWHWPGGDRSDDDYRLEILDAPLLRPDRRVLVYRLRHNDSIVFCGDDIEIPAHVDLRDDTTPRAIVAMLTDSHPADLTPHQQRFLDDHSNDLAALVAEIPAPYLPGTRIQVPGDDDHRETGAVLSVNRHAGTVASYTWRPDTADLPGHPWQHLTGTRASCTTDAARIAATLLGPDTGLHHPGPLAPGAVVRYLTDDGATLTGDVVRAFPARGDVDYDVRFHGQPPDEPPVPMYGRDLQAVRGTAWPSVDALLVARRADTTDPPQPGELLAADDGTHARLVLDHGGSEPVWVLTDQAATAEDFPLRSPSALPEAGAPDLPGFPL